MALPESIRIGGIDYKVVKVAGLRDGNTGLNGHILYNSCEIRIESEMTPQVKWITAWHEVIHGIFEHAAVKHNEQTVMALGYGIAQVLRDNPWLREVDNESKDNRGTN